MCAQGYVPTDNPGFERGEEMTDNEAMHLSTAMEDAWAAYQRDLEELRRTLYSSSLATAVTKTRLPQTTGHDHPQPGTEAFQSTFPVFDH